MRRRAEAEQRETTGGTVARAPQAPGVSAVGDRRQGARPRVHRAAAGIGLCVLLPQGSMSVLVGIRIATEKEDRRRGGEVVGRKRTIAYSCILFCFLTTYTFFPETVKFRFKGHKKTQRRYSRDSCIQLFTLYFFY
jgi:hypothetical protein